MKLFISLCIILLVGIEVISISFPVSPVNNIEEEISSEEDPRTFGRLVARFIKNQSDLNAGDYKGRTLAYRAAKLGDLETLTLLGKHGASYNLTDLKGMTPLHAAARKNKVNVVQYLIKQDIDADKEDFYRKTAFHRAAESGSLDSLKALIGNKTDVNRRVRYYDATAMHFAAKGGHAHVVKELSKYNNTVNVRDADERSALWHAVTSGQVETVKELISVGADITPTITWEAVDRGFLNVVKFLVSKGANVNAKAHADSSLLVRAAYRNHPEIAKFLLDKGADVRTTCCYIRWTPLHEAAAYDRLDIAKLYVDHGADINARDRRGSTPLDVAGPSVCNMLYERGAKFSWQQ